MRAGSLLSRAAAVLLLAVTIWAVVILVEAPMFAAVADDRARLAAAAAVFGADGNSAGRLAAWRKLNGQLDAFIDSATWRLDRSSPELLSAQLQRDVEKDASQAGAVVSSSRTVAARNDGDLTQVGLEFEMRSSLPALQKLLHALGAARPPIFVDRLTAQGNEAGTSSKAADGQNEVGVTLHLAIYAAQHRAGVAL
jgi:hypothetical protein